MCEGNPTVHILNDRKIFYLTVKNCIARKYCDMLYIYKIHWKMSPCTLADEQNNLNHVTPYVKIKFLHSWKNFENWIFIWHK